MRLFFSIHSIPAIIILLNISFSCQPEDKPDQVHTFEVYEIQLNAEKTYDNPYMEVKCWVDLEGPGFKKRIYGFWNGGNEFIVRVAATSPGTWGWVSQSNQDDAGLNEKYGRFEVFGWSPAEKEENPNRRGFIRASEDGHSLVYSDGHPFFMIGDTWWAASTWRYPLKGTLPEDDYVPGPGISFEDALAFRKNQGYNTIAMIAAFPNWKIDEYPPEYMNEDNIGIRQAWEKNGENTAKDMHDETGNMPFEMWDPSAGQVADFNRINPEYFKSLDRKIRYLNEQGFIPFLETVRRDHGPSWKAYFEWPESFARYVQYIVARYGAFNLIFSGIHLDWIPEDYSLNAYEFNEALTFHYNTYGPLPYGQPYTTLIDGSTYLQFGHDEEAPWLTMHSVGNVPRNHGFYPMLEELYNLDPPYPAANMEPYYPGWDNPFHNTVAGERPEVNSERDNYFARAQMYGSVLSGGLAGHIYGTGAYCGNTTGEPKNPGDRPFIWEGLNYPSGRQMQYLAKFILSEGNAYQKGIPSRKLLIPHKTKDAPEKGLDGWSFLLLTSEKDLGLLYFENKSEIPVINGLLPGQTYKLDWYDPENGEWFKFGAGYLKADKEGTIFPETFPGGKLVSSKDWCLKIKKVG